MKAAFDRYIGIDYSGAETCDSSLKGLRVYMAEHSSEPREVAPPPSLRRYWTRKTIAEWLVEKVSETSFTTVGIDHGFSFPLQYFEKYDLPRDWPSFLDDFQKHWPTDEKNTYVAKASVGMARLVVAIHAGEESRKCARVQNRSFILMCPDQSPNLPMPEFRGCAFSACAPRIESISGRLMAGSCRRASRRSGLF